MAGGGRLEEGAVRGPVTTVFVSDPTAEAERAAQALRVAGYAVVDVPLSMLVARVAVQCPSVILIDADGDGALDAVTRMRELPDADAIHVLFVSRPGGAIASPDESLAHEGSGLFVRPVDVPALVRKVESLAGKPRGPSLLPLYVRETHAPQPSLPPPSMRSLPYVPPTPVPPPLLPRGRPPSEPPPSGSALPPRRVAGLGPPPVSGELQQLLADAELRMQVRAETESMMPSPEEEIEAVLPAELLAALDEPLEAGDDEDEVHARPHPGADAVRERGHEGGSRTTGASTTGSGATPHEERGGRGRPDRATRPPPGSAVSATHAEPTGAAVSTTEGAEVEEGVDRFTPSGPSPTGASLGARADESVVTGDLDRAQAAALAQADGGALPTILGAREAMPAVARAIASRVGGVLCFVEGAVERRLVLREGDVVTAVSSAEDESLLEFLGSRGDLPRETVRRLGAKFPTFGRHGGAALVARGYLGQDQMWPTLRAHAEWLLARVLQMQSGRLVVEGRPSGRLGSEPSVFGGSTGAEVFVELVRRIVSPADAIERLGGAGSRLGEGRAAALMSECALAPVEVERLRAGYGSTLRAVFESSPEGDLATVIFALTQLEVLEVLRAVGARSGAPEGPASDAALDAEAIRERVRARAQLVDDGDYFAVLGVAARRDRLRGAPRVSRAAKGVRPFAHADARGPRPRVGRSQDHPRPRRSLRDPEGHGEAGSLPPRHRGRSRRQLVHRRRGSIKSHCGGALANSRERIRGLGGAQGSCLVRRPIAERNNRFAIVDGTSRAVH